MLRTTAEAVGDLPEAAGDLRGKLDVVQPTLMAERLGAASLGNFLRVMEEAAAQGGVNLSEVRFLGITHMKRSFYLEILAALGLTAEQSVYLEDYGHVQSADQAIALELGLAQGKIGPGDVVMLAGAGVGYTWSAAAVRWGEVSV